MKKPKFYCTQFLDCEGNLPKYQPADCPEQCSVCMDIIIDHHVNKKAKETGPIPEPDDDLMFDVQAAAVRGFHTPYHPM